MHPICVIQALSRTHSLIKEITELSLDPLIHTIQYNIMCTGCVNTLWWGALDGSDSNLFGPESNILLAM